MCVNHEQAERILLAALCILYAVSGMLELCYDSHLRNRPLGALVAAQLLHVESQPL